ncbi:MULTISPECIES: ACT domain-containing protein [unclassified Sporolactobacillus]|uniref:ACT domain-containing protein n=1 Tax=unclassified Sporolactobacillus TaxID=2628533 RepID=UPI0023689F7C|nr:ACT domain-containing protein [Sporolactobacillus sp. CQH2019]MDD9148305.1 ACT domain-containing protein [Sporolactobacillus sp. CQH2019]
MNRTVHAKVSAEKDALSRVAAVFSRYRLNIGSLTYQRSGTTSDMNIVTDIKNERQARQLIGQLNKLVDVISAADISEPSANRKRGEEENTATGTNGNG